MTADAPLPPGTAHLGRVRRRGDDVVRPRSPGATARHALLRHLEAVGFDGAPRVRGLADDTEVLSFMPGVVPDGEAARGGPLPEYAAGDGALRSVGRLLRRLHDATVSFDATAWSWPGAVPAEVRGTDVVAHNDPHPGNVVFAGSRAVAFIDFDLAEPATRAFDLATAACFWVPLLDPVDVDAARRDRLHQRFVALCDGYDADRALRRATSAAAPAAHDGVYRVIRDGAAAGHPGFARSWRTRRAAAERGRAWIARTLPAW